MSHRANPLDNALMQSFFHTLKTELVHHKVHATRDQARRDLFACVERVLQSSTAALWPGLPHAEVEQKALGVA